MPVGRGKCYHLGRRLSAAIGLALLAGCTPNGALETGQNGTLSTGAVSAKAATGQTSAAPSVAQPARSAAAVKAGLVLPLGAPGQAGLIADTLRKAAELALIEANAPHVQLVIRDDKGTPEGADAATREALTAGAEIVIGPLFARSVQAAAPAARAKGVPILAFSNDRQVAGQGVSLLSFLPEPEVQRVVAYAAGRGKKRFMALVPDDAYGKIVEAAFRAAVARNGGQVVALEIYPAQANGMLDAVRRLRDTVRGLEEHGDPVDALFLPGGEETLATLLPQLKQAQIDPARVQIIGTGGLDYANSGRDAGLVGAWFAAPDPRGWKDFSDKYAKAYGHAPPRIASLAYDAVGLVVALSNGPDGARYIPSQLARGSGFSGADGLFRLTSEGTAERLLAVLDVQPFGARVIDPAGAAFGDERSAQLIPHAFGTTAGRGLPVN